MARRANPRDRLSYWLREIILGGQDGLVNVLALVLAVAGATSNTRLILISGLAAAAAESISMAAVAYTSTRATDDYYRSRLLHEIDQVENDPEAAERDVREIYTQKGFRGEELEMIVRRITASRRVWVDTMMAEELRLFPEAENRARASAAVVGMAAVVGSLVPLIPFAVASVGVAMVASLVVSVITLFATGAIKARMTVGNWVWNGVQMAGIGMGAALAGYGIGVLLGRMLERL